eukprot:scaffold65684_cov65-Cyclotella_meneghiniana.AAC.1
MPTEMPTEPTNFWCRDDRRSRTEWPLRRVHFCEICRWGVWGDKEISLLGSSDFTPRLCMSRLIQGYHSISTLPTSHYKYNEWLEKAEIAA